MGLETYASGFLGPEESHVNLRRNHLVLFDQMRNEVVKLDVTIGVSLLDRQEHANVQ